MHTHTLKHTHAHTTSYACTHHIDMHVHVHIHTYLFILTHMHIDKKWRNVLLTMNEGTSKHDEHYSNKTMNKAKIEEKCFFHLRKQS